MEKNLFEIINENKNYLLNVSNKRRDEETKKLQYENLDKRLDYLKKEYGKRIESAIRQGDFISVLSHINKYEEVYNINDSNIDGPKDLMERLNKISIGDVLNVNFIDIKNYFREGLNKAKTEKNYNAFNLKAAISLIQRDHIDINYDDISPDGRQIYSNKQN